jgi:hypothetical protein
MPDDKNSHHGLASHGASRLPNVLVDSYNIEVKDENGFLGDRASKKAFHALLEKWRKPLRKLGADPFGDEPSDALGKKKLDAALNGKDADAAGVVHGVVEDFATELAYIIRRFLKTKDWRDTEEIVVGGGMREHQIGELAMGRAGVLLKADGINIDLRPISRDPDDAGLVGAVQLAPSWIFGNYDSVLAVDIGGTNMRAGVVLLNVKKSADLAKAAVWKKEMWRHADEKPKRDEAVGELTDMLKKLIKAGNKEGLALAPFIGIGCPGKIDADGSIDRGAQNLPGNWESARFNLPAAIVQAIPTIGEHDTAVVMHNDAVLQGLSEVPSTRGLKHWGILTLGTGLGNARFTTRTPEKG